MRSSKMALMREISLIVSQHILLPLAGKGEARKNQERG
jgi:hypothetical protein